MTSKKIYTLIFALLFFSVLSLQTDSITAEDSAKFQKTPKLIQKGHYLPPKMQNFIKEHESYVRRNESRMKDSIMRTTASSSNVDLIKFWPYGPCSTSALDMSRNLAVIGNGYSVQVLDVSSPSLPSLLGEVTITDEPRDIEILGNYAYVLTFNMLFIVDITIPAAPSVTGSEVIPDQGLLASGFELAVCPGYVYAAAGEVGCKVFDVSDPSDPEIVGSSGGSFSHSVAVNGDYMYILVDWYDVDWLTSVLLYDITSRSSPSFLGYYDSPQGDYFPYVDGTDSGIAYVTHNSSSGGSFHIIDFATNPSSPSVLGTYNNSSWYMNHVEVSGIYAYIGEADLPWSTYQMEILNISSPSSPSYLGGCTIPYVYMEDFDLSGNYIGVANYDVGISLYNISNPVSPSLDGEYDVPAGFASNGTPIVLSGDYAYLANRTDGLRIMDISTPSDPVSVGSCDTVYASGGISLSENYVFGVDGSGVWVVDVSTPSSPVELPYYDIPWTTMGVTVVGKYAYVTGYELISSTRYARLYVLDVSNPSFLSFVGSYEWIEESRTEGKFVISGDYLYLVLGNWLGDWKDDCLKIVDISTPASPNPVGTLFYDDAYLDDPIAVRGDYAYLSSGSLHVVNISNPLSPSEVTSVPLSGNGFASDIKLSGNFAYLACRTLSIFDISNPSAPFEAGYYYPDMYVGDSVAVSGNHAYVLGSLHILKNTLAPEVSIASPSDWATVSGSVSISAEASHTSGITQVEFYVDGALEGTDATSPYSYVWDSTAVENGSYTIRARAYNTDGNSSDFDITVTVNNTVDPAPDIKANGSDSPITITRADMLTINISIDPGTYGGTNADWWLLVKTPFGWFHYDLSQDWLPGQAVSRQGSLFKIPNYEVLNRSGLPKGTYLFIFGVDLNMNGVIDMTEAYYDRVKVTIN